MVTAWISGRPVYSRCLGLESLGLWGDVTRKCGPACLRTQPMLLVVGAELDGIWVQLVQQQMEDTMRAQEEMTRRLAALEHRPGIPVPEKTPSQVG